MKLQPGTEVTPNVRLESPIATGAMGSVWLAEHLTLNTKVAVKFISDRLDTDEPEVLERFVREASTAAQIKSSHVVQTFDQGVMRDGVPYIVMEHLEGIGLGERLQNEGRLPFEQVRRIVQQTAKALNSAHKLGIVHRDIKPDNIFLATHDDELHVKVFDFGIAKHRREANTRRTVPPDTQPPGVVVADPGASAQPELGLTNDGVMIGTPEYMSPEQVMSASSVDHHADLWGLAVVAYACLTGHLPFAGSDVGELCVNLLEASFAPPSSHASDLPRTLDDFFAKALAREPEQRFQSAREFAHEFALALPVASQPDDVLLGLADARPSVPSWSDGDEPLRSSRGVRAATFSGTEADAVGGRRRLSSSVIGLFVVLLLAGVVVALVLGGGESPVADTPVPKPKPATSQTQAPEPKETSTAPTPAMATPSVSVSASGKPPSPPRPYRRYPASRPQSEPKSPGF